ncbi:MAG: hypothetical protein Q9167_007894 [Letrouitia subvulpina]
MEAAPSKSILWARSFCIEGTANPVVPALTPPAAHRCHHLHTNVPLRLPWDPERHLRFPCEHCGHPMFGIGRTSTQTTLASVETVPVEDLTQRTVSAEGQRESQAFAGQARSPPTLQTPPHANQEQLSTISEGNSPSRRSPSASYTDAQNLSDGGHLFHVTEECSPSAPGNAEQVREHHSQNRPTSRDNRTSRLSTRIKGFKGRLFSKSRGFRIPRLGVHFGITPASQANQRPLEKISQPNTDSHHSEPVTAANPGLGLPSTLLMTPTASSPPTHEPADEQGPTSHPDPIANGPQRVEAKKEHVRAKRKEATLKRRRTQMSTCECLDYCQCRVASDSNMANDGRRSSDFQPEIHIPDHPLDNLISQANSSNGSSGDRPSSAGRRVSFLTGIGSHLSPSRRGSGTEGTSSSVTGSSQRRFDNMSQGTTVVEESNSSSIALTRPALSRRSLSAPANPRRLPADSARSSIRETLHNNDFLARLPNQLVEIGSLTGSPPTRSDSVASSHQPDQYDRRTGSSTLVNDSSTSLSNLPDPDDDHGRQYFAGDDLSQEGSQPAALNSPTINSDILTSQDITPTPSSYQNQENGQSTESESSQDGMSEALQRLANQTQRTDQDNDVDVRAVQ